MKRKIGITTIQFSSGSVSAMRGRQSVRATFRLSERAIQALSVLACQLGIQQKSLFDHLMSDVKTLESIARSSDASDLLEQRVAKTYVMSRTTLENLERASKHFQTPRDVLVETIIEQIVPLIEQEKIKHQKRKKLHNHFEKLLETTRHTVRQGVDELDRDDPVVQRYLSSLRSIENSVEEVRAYLDKTSDVEEF